MGQLGRGVLGGLSGAAEAVSNISAQSISDQAQKRRDENLHRLKQDLQKSGQEFQTGERKASEKFQKGQKGSGRFEGGVELTKEEYVAKTDKPGVLSTTQQNVLKDEREINLINKKRAPLELKRTYDFLVGVFGEEKAKSLIQSSIITKGKKGTESLDRQKLYRDVYNDYIKTYTDGGLTQPTSDIVKRAEEAAERGSGHKPPPAKPTANNFDALFHELDPDLKEKT